MAFRAVRSITDNDISRILAFIRETVAGAHAEGAVVGISGGIDSAVVVKLCADALGADKVHAIFMPVDSTPKEDYRQTESMCQAWGVRYDVIDIQSVSEEFGKMLSKPGDDPLQKGNMMSRCRMIVLFDAARREKSLVFGTTNRSELLMGYMTKFGDGAEDASPICRLYKTQVWEIARLIGVPEEIISKVPTAGLWEGQTDEAEMGVTYLALDKALNVMEQGASDAEMASAAGITETKAAEIRSQVSRMMHKHSPAYAPDDC